MATAVYTHRALFHRTDAELLAGLVPFVRSGIDADERVVVVVRNSIGETLREQLGTSQGFDLLDSSDLYTFPSHTLSNYIDTVRDGTADGRPMRVAGEPVWAGRSAVEIAEWTCVEAACNVAFADSPLQMLCPYDVSVLAPDVIAAARRTHPEIVRDSQIAASPEFSPLEHHLQIRAGALAPYPPRSEQISIFGVADVAQVVRFVDSFARSVAMAANRVDDLTSAVHLLATDASRIVDDRSGPARLRLWIDGADLICQLESPTMRVSPFAEMIPPSNGGDGLWLVGQRCDVIAVRVQPDLTVVRLHYTDFLVSRRPQCGGNDLELGVYALGMCDSEQAAQIEVHLGECIDCRNESERLGRAAGHLGEFPGHWLA